MTTMNRPAGVRGFNSEMQRIPQEATEVERMAALINTISSYVEHYHGGEVEMVGYADEVVSVHLSGACEGCSLAPVTLHGWVEGTVKQFFPQVKAVVAV